MSASVHARHDYDLIVNNSIEKTIRKPLQVCTACLPVDNRKAFSVCRQGFNDCPDHDKEFVAKTGTLVFIPAIGIFDIRSSGRPKDRRLHLTPRADLLQDVVPRDALRS